MTGRFPRRLRHAARGATVVEFGLISVPLLLCLFMVVDTGLSLAAQAALDNAVNDQARQIEVGKIGAADAATFRSGVCARVSNYVPSCSTTLQIYVTSGSSFAGLTRGSVSSAGVLTPTGFAPGAASASVLVQVVYNRVSPFAFLGRSGVAAGGPILATTTIQNEPF